MNRATSLGGIEHPTPVELRGVIVSGLRVSPVTGHAAAIIQYYVFVPGDPGQGLFASPTPDRLLATGFFGDAVLLRVGDAVVRVPFTGLEVYFAGTNAQSIPLDPALAFVAQLQPDHQMLARQRALHYRELSIASHTNVRLHATVTPTEGSPYRVDASFTVVDPPARLSVDVPELA